MGGGRWTAVWLVSGFRRRTTETESEIVLPISISFLGLSSDLRSGRKRCVAPFSFFFGALVPCKSFIDNYFRVFFIYFFLILKYRMALKFVPVSENNSFCFCADDGVRDERPC